MKNTSDSNSLLLVIKQYKLINLHAENRLLYFILITLLCLNSTFLFLALIYPVYFIFYFTLLYFTLLTFVKLEPGENRRHDNRAIYTR